jgi:hypothetical protein
MKIIESEMIIMSDIDDTLILDSNPNDENENYVDIVCPYSGQNERRKIHEAHVKLVREKKARGYTIFAWSAAGYQWAAAVIKALGLENEVDFAMSKPTAYLDDLPASSWMPYRIYIPVKEKIK